MLIFEGIAMWVTVWEEGKCYQSMGFGEILWRCVPWELSGLLALGTDTGVGAGNGMDCI